MNDKERELVNEELINNPLCYNMMLGGEGGDTWSNTGKRHSIETKKKISEKVSNYIKESGINGHKIRSERQKQIWIEMRKDPKKLELINRKRSETLKQRIKENPHIRGHKLSDETKKKISESIKAKIKKR